MCQCDALSEVEVSQCDALSEVEVSQCDNVIMCQCDNVPMRCIDLVEVPLTQLRDFQLCGIFAALRCAN
jgi:hypothetical protein